MTSWSKAYESHLDRQTVFVLTLFAALSEGLIVGITDCSPVFPGCWCRCGSVAPGCLPSALGEDEGEVWEWVSVGQQTVAQGSSSSLLHWLLTPSLLSTRTPTHCSLSSVTLSFFVLTPIPVFAFSSLLSPRRFTSRQAKSFLAFVGSAAFPPPSSHPSQACFSLDPLPSDQPLSPAGCCSDHHSKVSVASYRLSVSHTVVPGSRLTGPQTSPSNPRLIEAPSPPHLGFQAQQTCRLCQIGQL